MRAPSQWCSKDVRASHRRSLRQRRRSQNHAGTRFVLRLEGEADCGGTRLAANVRAAKQRTCASRTGKEGCRDLGDREQGVFATSRLRSGGHGFTLYRYRSSRPNDAGLRKRLRELAAERRRFGYRRLHLLLKREGVAINWKKLYRLYKEERVTVRKRGGRKRALGTRAPIAIISRRWIIIFPSQAELSRWRKRLSSPRSATKPAASVITSSTRRSRAGGGTGIWIGSGSGC